MLINKKREREREVRRVCENGLPSISVGTVYLAVIMGRKIEKKSKNTLKAAESHFSHSIADRIVSRESINRLAQSGCGSYRSRMFAGGCETHTPGYKLRCVYSLVNFLRNAYRSLRKMARAVISLSPKRGHMFSETYYGIIFCSQRYRRMSSRTLAVTCVMTLSDNSILLSPT